MIEYSVLTDNFLSEASKTEQMCLHEGWTAEQISATIKNGGVYFMATENGQMAGHVGISHFCGEGYITNVAVRESFRKKGIGTGLIETLLSFAKENNLEFVSLEVRASNLAAIKLYEKCGFVTVGERKNFYTSPTENALVMTKYLK